MTDIVKRNGAPQVGLIRDMDDIARASAMLAGSGYFQDAKSAMQAGVKVMAGFELGIGAFAAMAGIHIIEGKPSIGAGIMAAAIKDHPKYDYKVRHLDAQSCRLEFFEDGESVGFSEYSIADAKQAKVAFTTSKGHPTNWVKNPRNMLFARALSNGQKWYAPDVFRMPVYTPDELGAEEDDQGRVVVERVEAKAGSAGLLDALKSQRGEVKQIEAESVEEPPTVDAESRSVDPDAPWEPSAEELAEIQAREAAEAGLFPEGAA